MPNRYAVVLAALVGAASVGACRDDTPPEETAAMPSVPAAFPNLLFPPNGQLVARAGSEDALQLIFHSPEAPDLVTRTYRSRLGAPPWRIVSDEASDSGATIYAEADGHPLWVRISPDSGAGTRVELNGAVLAAGAAQRTSAGAAADSAPAPSARDEVLPDSARLRR